MGPGRRKLFTVCSSSLCFSLVRSRWKVAYNHHKAGATMTAAMTTTIAVALRTGSSPFVILIFASAQEELICLAEVLKPSA
jgi:hypothetical protein